MGCSWHCSLRQCQVAQSTYLYHRSIFRCVPTSGGLYTRFKCYQRFCRLGDEWYWWCQSYRAVLLALFSQMSHRALVVVHLTPSSILKQNKHKISLSSRRFNPEAWRGTTPIPWHTFAPHIALMGNGCEYHGWDQSTLAMKQSRIVFISINCNVGS